MKFGFLLNHYTGHQAYHSLPVAFSLSENHPDHEVTILVSNPSIYDQAQDIGTLWPGHKCKIKLARVPWWINLVDKVIGKIVFIKKEAVLRCNTSFFKNIDVLVVPEKNSLRLKTNPELSHLKFVRIRHGAGDRNTGLDESNKLFDLILASGEKMKKRLLDSKFATEDKIEVIGYPKFDIIEQKPLPKPIFNNGKPTILYAPHFKKAESSWINFGIDVLDFFEHNTDYNLIFAPHILLYKRGWRHGAKSLRSYETCENIYIDTGSDASIDMTYTRQADIYLGDMSSQVYEFLHTLKPCIFLNAHAVTNWENDETYLHWLMGDVIDTIDDLEPALKKAQQQHKTLYKKQQKKILSATFDLTDMPSCQRAANALVSKFSSKSVGE